MSKLLEFAAFLRHRKIAVDDLDEFSRQLIEPLEHLDGAVGYRLKPLHSTEKITQRCEILVYYTWHCRDYLKKVLEENGCADPGKLVNTYIAASNDVQVASFLANHYKHSGTDATQRWATAIAPRFAKPYAHGVMLRFPHRLKPTFIIWGESIPEFEFVGSAGVDDLVFHFSDFTWTFSCTVEDKNGVQIGNALSLCENTFATWIQILSDNGIAVPQ